jgi:hypothetical protein
VNECQGSRAWQHVAHITLKSGSLLEERCLQAPPSCADGQYLLTTPLAASAGGAYVSLGPLLVLQVAVACNSSTFKLVATATG